MLCLYVDDAIIITGHKSIMEKTVKGLSKTITLKVQKSIEDFLGCEILQGDHKIHITQQRIVDRILKANPN